MSELDYSRSSAPIGREWLVDAFGCDAGRLADLETLRGLLEAVVADLGLHRLGPAVWHRFADPGGVTGMYLLAESHLTCHTWPELGTAAFNLFCCNPRPDWPWQARLRDTLAARNVSVRAIERGDRREAGR